MGQPRAARKQPIIVSSDDEEDQQQYSPPSKRPRTRTLTNLTQSRNAEPQKRTESYPLRSRPASTPSSKPASSLPKQKSPSKSPSKPKPVFKSKPITSFFGSVPLSQRSKRTPSPEKQSVSAPIEEEDEILDSSADERPPAPKKAAPASTRAATKRGRDELGPDTDGPPKGSQMFKRADPAGVAASSKLQDDDRRPWNEKYGPINLDELAVHKRKVADVRTWLCDVFGGRQRKRLLLLKGPAGSGKTTTVQLLSKDMGVEINEWKNPLDASYASESGLISVTAQFQDFVGRTGKFGSLSFDSTAPDKKSASSSSSSSSSSSTTTDRKKQLILVEEFPNTFTRSSTAVQSFRSSILQYLASNVPSASSYFTGQRSTNEAITPIIMIVSETLLSTNTAAADSFTAHRLLGPEILTHPGVTVIEFNPIAQTLMAKALDRVVVKEARKSGRRRTPGPQVLKALSETGDVRSAISGLEFLCLRGDEGDGWGSKVAFTKPKKAVHDAPLTQMEKESLEMVTQRESTLGIFHAVGRVVYNKRLADDPDSASVPQPPYWLPEFRRPKASEVNIDTLIDELGTDTQTFMSALHENYILSCEGSTSEDTMDCIDGCIEALSNADLLSPDRFSTEGNNRRTFQGTSADNLRQDEMSFQASVRGLLFSLPYPVKRVAPPAGTMTNKGKGGLSKGSAHQMYYPASLRLWRQQEEIGGLLDLWISRAQRGELFTAHTASRKPTETVKPGSVENWQKSTPYSQPSSKFTPPASASQVTASQEEPPGPVLLGSGGSARSEMLLERLPYLPMILQRKSRALSSMAQPTSASTAGIIREIQKITSFSGHGVALTSASDDEDGDDNEGISPTEQEQWTTDAPAEKTPKEKKKTTGKAVKIEAKEEFVSAVPGLVVEKDVERLVLSDDDIED